MASAVVILCEQIDWCRCKGQWDVLKVLVAAFNKKRFGGNSANLEALWMAEANLNILIDSIPGRRFRDHTIAEWLVAPLERLPQDAPIHSSGWDAIESELKAVLDQTRGKSDISLLSSGEISDKSIYLQTLILLAQLETIKCQPEAASKYLAEIMDAASLISSSGVFESHKILGVRFNFLRGWTNLVLGKLSEAKEWLDRAQPLLASSKYYESPLKKVQPSKPDADQWTLLAEDVLYSLSITNLKLKNTVSAKQSLVQYTTTSFKNVPTPFRFENQVIILYQLVLMCLESELEPTKTLPSSLGASYFPSSSIPNPLSGVPASRTALHPAAKIKPGAATQLRELLARLEHVSTTLMPFPRGEDQTSGQKWRYDRVNEVYDWWVLLESISGGDGSEGIESHFRLIETLYRGTRHTFQSLKLLRYLGHTFCSLLHHLGDTACEEERDEAFAAIEAYNGLFKQKLDLLVSEERKRRRELKLAGTLTSGTDEADSEETVSLDDVEGESMLDAVGVLMSGVRMGLLYCAGDDQKLLEQCSNYARFAVELVHMHGPAIERRHGASTFSWLRHQVFQMFGIIQGELSQEVTNSDDRKRLQTAALEALKESIRSVPHAPGERSLDESTAEESEIPYQSRYILALQLAEIGEVAGAVEELEIILSRNQGHLPSWNLLALLISAGKDFDRALQVCEIGWTEGVNQLNASFGLPEGTAFNSIPWSEVDTDIKVDLLNLRITHIDITQSRFGAEKALEELNNTFPQFERIFQCGKADQIVNGTTIYTPPAATSLERKNSRGSVASSNTARKRSLFSVSKSPRPESVASTALSIAKNPSPQPSGVTSATVIRCSAPPHGLQENSTSSSRYMYSSFDILVTLLLMASSLYRKLGKLDEAHRVTEECEAIVRAWIRVDTRARELRSRIATARSGAEISLWPDSDKKTPIYAKKRGSFTAATAEAPRPATVSASAREDLLQKWGWSHASMRRVVADLMFEMFLIREADFRQTQKRSAAPRYSKYLSSASFEKWKESNPTISVPGRIDSSESDGSRVSSQITLARSVMNLSRKPATPDSSVPNGINSSVNGTEKPGRADSIPDVWSPKMTAKAASDGNASTRVPSGALAQLIEQVHLITFLDDHHLGAQVKLASLYLERGQNALLSEAKKPKTPSPLDDKAPEDEDKPPYDPVVANVNPDRVAGSAFDLPQAEYWFERACKRGKGHGSLAGAYGLRSSHGGGLTGPLGVEAWVGLGNVLRLSKTMEASADCMLFASELERVTPLRGFQCLRRNL